MSLKKVRTWRVQARALGFMFAFLFLIAPLTTAAASPKKATWTELARKVGESEDGRAAVIADLRKVKNLNTTLKKAIYTKQRPLALDVISALELKNLIPDLLFHVPADPDGFLTVAINSMMDAKNQPTILKSYTDNLAVDSIAKVSSAAIVAMLEPLGRLSIVLPPATMAVLESHPAPEVRSSTLYYVRVMALRNHHYENVDALAKLLKATEFQIRLQAVSVSTELLGSGSAPKDKLPSRENLKSVCDAEKTSTIRVACAALMTDGYRKLASDAIFTKTPRASGPAMTCAKMEAALYANPVIRVRMIFGYKDARPARFVGDRHERLAFIERVTTPCDSKSLSCGFARSHDNADLFLKHVKVRGRDHKVLLWVVNSSVGTDDQENRADPFQLWKSKYAEEAFLTGLRDADVVLYDGHSRFGGGPDFTPPKLGADGAVDPSTYQSDRPGLTKMLSALEGPTQTKSNRARNSSSKLKILGLFSCSSSQHFTQEIHQVAGAGVVSSKVLMYYSDALNQSVKTLDDVLKAKCPKAISF